MVLRRYSIFAAISAALCVASSAIAAACHAVERFVGAMFDVLARPGFDRSLGFNQLGAFDGPALAYDGPPVHGLRHEAGVSRRAAARHT
jgi:hypothetical protein